MDRATELDQESHPKSNGPMELAELSLAVDLGYVSDLDEIETQHHCLKCQPVDPNIIQFCLDHQHESELGYLDVCLGRFYETQGTFTDRIKAFEAYQLSASKKNPVGLYMLSYALGMGIGCEKNLRLALTTHAIHCNVSHRSDDPLRIDIHRIIYDLLKDPIHLDFVFETLNQFKDQEFMTRIFMQGYYPRGLQDNEQYHLPHSNPWLIDRLFERICQLQTRNADLKRENDQILQHLEATPDGDLYLEAQEHWKQANKSMNNKNMTLI